MAPKYKAGYVVVGAGHAGTVAAETLRKLDGDTPIYCIDSDPDAFYYRAAVKFIIKNTLDPEQIYGRVDKFWKDRKIERITDSVARVDRDAQTIVLNSGDEIPYTKMLLATGGIPFIPQIKGSNLRNISPLRSLRDTLRICKIADKGRLKRCVILGGGVLGTELAEALAHRGLAIDLITKDATLIPKMLDKTGSDFISQLAVKGGVTLHFNESIKEIKGTESLKVTSVETTSGKVIPCDAVFICTGIRRDVALAKECGLVTERGIIIDSHMHTSDPDIFAAGDVVEFHDSAQPELNFIELWGPAGKMGETAAHNMLGQNHPFQNSAIHAYTMLWGHSIHAIGRYNLSNQGSFIIKTARDEVGGKNNYYKLVFDQRKIVGCLSVGQARDPMLMEVIISRGLEIPQIYSYDQVMARDFDYNLIIYTHKS